MASAQDILILAFCSLLLELPMGCHATDTRQPRLRLSHKELWDLNRTSVFHSPFGYLGLHIMLLDEYQERLFVGGRDLLYSLSLDRVSDNYREIHWPSTPLQAEECIIKGRDADECANYVRVLHRYNRTHLLACGTGAFDPLCTFIRVGHPSEVRNIFHSNDSLDLYCGELFTGLYSDYWGRDAAVFRTMNRMAHLRTEPDSERLLKEPKFVGSYMIPDNEDHNDNKVYFFFTEKALEAETSSHAIYTRVGRVCANDMGGQRMLVNKWSTFLKTRLVCSVPGRNGIDTYFDELEDVFLLQTRDNKNPVIFGLFNTTSNIFRGYAVCVYHMASVRAAFNGPYAHKEGPEYHWALYEGKVPYPRPGSCASKVNGGLYTTTKDYPDEAVHFARSHPLMYQPIKPVHKRPILVKTDGKYNLKQIAVDRVEAEDGQYDVLFIGTDNGIVLKVITIYNQETESMEEVILEELQVFKVNCQQLYIGSESVVAQVKFHQCDMYGTACADCCLARDPYCAWDGISCSRYYPTGMQAKRRFRRQDVRHGNAAQQCFGQQFIGEVLEKTEERLVYGIEYNSTLLECTPRTLQAKVIWLVQRAHETKKEEVIIVMS
uniref:Semaphorin 3E n=1 Tax=Cairina moschata TaxID=8855 RepID=A0A8C3GDA7_CAIMO